MARVFDLQTAMDRARVTRPELARRLGVSLPMVHYWATGKKLPAARRLPQIAEALDCTIDELFAEQPCRYSTA